MKKRIISFFTALSMTFMLFTGMPLGVSAAVSGDGYSIDDNGKLTIANDTGMTNWKRWKDGFDGDATLVKSVVIQDGVTSIGEKAFSGCNAMSSITIPNSVRSIGKEAFNGCDALSSIAIPNSVTSIGEAAFAYSDALSSITIPNGVTSIGDRAFMKCTSLCSITISASVTKMGGSVNSGSTKIETITFEGAPPSGTNAINSFSGCDITAIYVPCKFVEQYNNAGVITQELKGKIQPKHNPAQVAAKAATCAAEGNVAHWHCSQCDKNFTDNTCATEETDVIIPKTDNHTWNAGTVTTAATCTATGVKKFTCTVCGQTKTEIIPKTAHSYGTSWSYNSTSHYNACSVCGDQKDTAAHSGGTATCQKQATCSVCGQKYGSLGAHDHSTTWSKDDTQHWHACQTAGCTDKSDTADHTFVQKKDGTNHWEECSVCGYKNDETAHSWGNWTLITEPTLNTTGTAERACGCGKKQTKADVPALTDSTVWTKGESQHVEPTEEETGKDVYTSTDYGTVEVVLPKTEHTHDWGNWSITAKPTLTTTGTAERACTKDSTHKDTTELPVLTDKTVWTKDESHHVEPTEEETGKDVYTSEYGNVEVVLPKKDHTHVWGNWLITVTPTLTAAGTAERACTKDSTHTETKELPVLTDTTVWTNDEEQHVEPTEEETGKDVYTSEYGEVEVVLPKKEHTHDWGNWSITANPTLTTTGTAERVCTKNGTHTETKELPVLTDTTVWRITEHVDPTEEDTGKDVYTSEYGNVEVVLPVKEHTHVLVKTDAQAADCTTKGNEAYWTCSGCNKMFSNENGTREITAIPTIPATGHTYSTDWTSDETSHWHAAICGHDVTSEAAAHTEDGGTVTTPPTAENDGVKTYACSVCGYVMRTVTIPKLGEDHNHSFSPDWKHDGTSHWHECDCGVKSDNSVHIENSGVVTTEPTETSTGIMTYSCETCGYVMRTDVIPALIPEHNHTFGTDWKYDSVSHWHECECGEKSDIANHISSDWIVVTPATIDLEGVQIKRCTVCDIEIDRETIEKLPNISTGDVAEDVRDTAGTNAGLVQDNTLIENVLTPDDKTEVTEGHSFEIVLEVTDIRDSVPAADVTAASSALRYNEQIGIYVDLSLFKIKDNSERTPIYNTSGRIGITLTVPDSIYASDRTYSIIRVHDGIAENLGGTYDKASRRLTFYTDKFSTYAIAYAASNSGTDRPTVPDTPTYPSVPTYPNTPVVPVTPTVTETTVKKEEEVISDEPYVEDVSSAAGIYENGETDNNIHYVMILIFAAAAGIAAIAAKKHFCKKNMK